jgi:predicted Fe-S protein YdhL (DUF1289 family)
MTTCSCPGTDRTIKEVIFPWARMDKMDKEEEAVVRSLRRSALKEGQRHSLRQQGSLPQGRGKGGSWEKREKKEEA